MALRTRLGGSLPTALSLLTGAERRRLARNILLSVPIGLTETFGLLSVYPMVAIASDLGVIDRSPFLGRLRRGIGLEGDPERFLLVLGCAFFAFFATGLAGRYLLGGAREALVAQISARMSSDLFERLLHDRLERHLGRNSTQLALLVRDRVFIVGNGIFLSLAMGLGQCAVILCLIGALSVMASVFSVVVAALIGLVYLGMYALAAPRLKQAGRREMQIHDLQSTLAREAFAGVRDLKSLGAEDAFARAFRDAAGALARLRLRSRTLREAPGYAVEFLVFGAIIIVSGLNLMQDMGPTLGAPPLIAVLTFICLRLKQAADKLFFSVARYRESIATLESVAAEFAAASALNPWKRERPARGVARHSIEEIALEGVSFVHAGATKPSVADLDLRLVRGSRVAIVGATGAGKSTLADLLLGLIAPTRGTATALRGGLRTPMAALPAGVMGYVPQSPVFLDASIAENIALGPDPGPPDMVRVREAARMACFESVVAALPGDYAARIGEGGAALSGGQRQRLALARAFYAAPQALVLDEATSALDMLTRQEVVRNIFASGSADMLIFITHDLAFAEACDRILVLDHGRVVGDGVYADLAAENPVFRALQAAMALQADRSG